MTESVRLTPPDGAEWSIEPVALPDGLVGIVIGFDLAGVPQKITLEMARSDSRMLARGIFKAGGDATERSFTGGSGRAGEGT